MHELTSWAADRPLFRVTDAQRHVELTPQSLHQTLHRLVDRGELHRLERGVYTAHDDPLIYATHIETPSFLSLWSGLRFYDLTTQQPTTLQVLVARARPALDKIRFYQTRALFGYGRHHYQGFEVFVADRERLLVDCLARPEVPVGALAELLAEVAVDRTITYAQRYGQAAVQKRVGYLLERHRGVDVTALRVDDRNYPPLDLAGPAKGPTDPDWRLRVNADA